MRCFRSLPVRSRGAAVEHCSPAVVFLVAVLGSRRLLVLGGEAVVHPGRPPEGVNAGDECLLRRSF